MRLSERVEDALTELAREHGSSKVLVANELLLFALEAMPKSMEFPRRKPGGRKPDPEKIKAKIELLERQLELVEEE